MDISIFIVSLLVLVCSIGGIVAVTYAIKMLVQDTYKGDSKWQSFSLLCVYVCVAIVLFGLMIGSVVAISEQLGFCSHSQVMYLLTLVDKPYNALLAVGLVLCGIYFFIHIRNNLVQS